MLRLNRRRALVALALATAATGAGGAAAGAAAGHRHVARHAAHAASFRAGAAFVSFTPPAAGALSGDAAACGGPAAAGFPGMRPFAFEEPYVDAQHDEHYDPGDPFLDCNGNGRWEGNTIGGGGNSPRFYDHVADPIGARALVISNGRSTLAMEVVDNEGLFNTYADRIRAAVAADGYRLSSIQISSTHDESAPDTIGLGGVNQVTSGTNQYFAAWLVARSAAAIEQAYRQMRPARLRYAEAAEPARLRQCWSSYPYIDDPLMPVMQAVGRYGVIATLASVSQHAETLGFNGGSQRDPGAPAPTSLDQENAWLSADWPHWFTQTLERRYGGVGIEMAGSVGSVETPEVFNRAVARTPQGYVDESHPAGCRTLFGAPVHAVKAPLGYYSETRALGESLAGAVQRALTRGARWSHTNTIWAQTVDICVPVDNALFKAAALGGVFAERTVYGPGCTQPIAPLPTGQAAGTSLLSQAAAWRIGDAEFIGAPGEVFPFTFFRGPVGPEDLNYPQYALPPWPLPRMTTPWRFFDGIDNDMIGYVFPRGNDAGVPGQNPTQNPTASDTDRFGCGHSDDAEAATDTAGDIIGGALMGILATHGRAEAVEPGRFVLGDGRLSRNPLGMTDTVKCTGPDTKFAGARPAVAVWEPRRGTILPRRWMDLLGRPQIRPDRNTRGYFDAHGHRHWLDVFPDLSGAPARVALPRRRSRRRHRR